MDFFDMPLFAHSTIWVRPHKHPEGTSKVSCKCDFSKVPDYNGGL